MESMQAIIDKCKKAKIEQGYSYEYIAKQSGIPKSTVERFFSANGTSCRYDTIYPIVRFLIGFDEEVPASPKEIEKQMPLPPKEMIEWYKEIINKRELEREKLVADHKTEIAELKSEHKSEIAEVKSEMKLQIETKQKNIVRLWIAVIILSIAMGSITLADILIRDIGWFL